jgi:hypothetical protein
MLGGLTYAAAISLALAVVSCAAQSSGDASGQPEVSASIGPMVAYYVEPAATSNDIVLLDKTD